MTFRKLKIGFAIAFVLLWIFFFGSSLYARQCANENRTYETRLQACNYAIDVMEGGGTDFRMAGTLMRRFVVHAEMGNVDLAKADAIQAIANGRARQVLTVETIDRMIAVAGGGDRRKGDDTVVELSAMISGAPASSPVKRIWLEVLEQYRQATLR